MLLIDNLQPTFPFRLIIIIYFDLALFHSPISTFSIVMAIIYTLLLRRARAQEFVLPVKFRHAVGYSFLDDGFKIIAHHRNGWQAHAGLYSHQFLR